MIVLLLDQAPSTGGKAFKEILPSNAVLCGDGGSNRAGPSSNGKWSLASELGESEKECFLKFRMGVHIGEVLFQLGDVVVPDIRCIFGCADQDVVGVFIVSKTAWAFGVGLFLPGLESLSNTAVLRGMFCDLTATVEAKCFHVGCACIPVDGLDGLLGESDHGVPSTAV